MEDEQLVLLNNICADLVGLEKCEAFPVHLLSGQQGQWVRAREVCAQTGINAEDLQGEVFATWLPDPAGAEGYALIIFFEEDAMWTLAARYNRRRLLREKPAGEERNDKVVPQSA